MDGELELHCLEPTIPEIVCDADLPPVTPFDPAQVFVTAGIDAAHTDDWRALARIEIPPESPGVCDGDIALAITRAPLASESESIPLRLSDPLHPGESYSAHGYGETETRDSGRRVRASGSVLCAGARCGAGIGAREWIGSATLCAGDSGGPALDESGNVIGVASRTRRGCENPVYSSVLPWASWLAAVVERASEQGGYPTPAWVEEARYVETSAATAHTQGCAFTARSVPTSSALIAALAYAGVWLGARRGRRKKIGVRRDAKNGYDSGRRGPAEGWPHFRHESHVFLPACPPHLRADLSLQNLPGISGPPQGSLVSGMNAPRKPYP